MVGGSRTIDPEENCPPPLNLTLTLTQILTLTGGNCPDTMVGNFVGYFEVVKLLVLGQKYS